MLHLTSCWWFHIYQSYLSVSLTHFRLFIYSPLSTDQLNCMDILRDQFCCLKCIIQSLKLWKCPFLFLWHVKITFLWALVLWEWQWLFLFCCCLSHPSCMLHCFSKLGYTEQLCEFDSFLWRAYNKFCSNTLTSISGVLWCLIFFNSEEL